MFEVFLYDFFLSDCSRYSTIWSFLSGYIDNEINLTPDGTCAKSCTDFAKTKHFNCANGTMCAELGPEENRNGLKRQHLVCDRDRDIYDCVDIGAEGNIIINVSKYGHYNFIEFKNGNEMKTYGFDPDDGQRETHNLTVSTNKIEDHHTLCQMRNFYFNSQASTWHAADKSECSNCYCFCHSKTYNRKFSLHEVVSNITGNGYDSLHEIHSPNYFLSSDFNFSILKCYLQSEIIRAAWSISIWNI